MQLSGAARYIRVRVEVRGDSNSQRLGQCGCREDTSRGGSLAAAEGGWSWVCSEALAGAHPDL